MANRVTTENQKLPIVSSTAQGELSETGESERFDCIDNKRVVEPTNIVRISYHLSIHTVFVERVTNRNLPHHMATEFVTVDNSRCAKTDLFKQPRETVDGPACLVFVRVVPARVSRAVAGRLRWFIGTQVCVRNNNSQACSGSKDSVAFFEKLACLIQEQVFEEVFRECEAEILIGKWQEIANLVIERQPRALDRVGLIVRQRGNRSVDWFGIG